MDRDECNNMAKLRLELDAAYWEIDILCESNESLSICKDTFNIDNKLQEAHDEIMVLKDNYKKL